LQKHKTKKNELDLKL